MSVPLILDAVALVLIIAAGLSGLAKGAVKVVGAVAGFALAAFLSWRLMTLVASLLFPRMEPVVLAHIIAFVIVFLAVMATVALLVFLLTKLLEAILLGWLNKLLGFAAGMLFGIIIVAALARVSVLVYPALEGTYSHTILIKLLLEAGYIIAPAAPTNPQPPTAQPV